MSPDTAIRRALEHAFDPILLSDADGRVVWTNPAFDALPALGQRTRIGDLVLDAVFGDTEAAERDTLAEALSANDALRGHVATSGVDGSTTWFDVSLSPAPDLDGVSIWRMREITVERQLHATLNRTLKMFEEIQRLGKIGVWEFELSSQNLHWSDEVFRIHGLAPDAGDPDVATAIEYYHEDARAVVTEAVERCIAEGEPYEFEAPIVRADGRSIWVMSRGFAQRDAPGGPVTRLHGVVQDISEQKDYQRELLEAREAAQQADKAKSTFLANMSHEIRTPMNGVMAMLDLVLQGALAPDVQRKLNTAQRSAEHLLQLLNDIIDLGKLEAGHLDIAHAPYNPRETIGDVVELFSARAVEKRLSLKFDAAPDVPDHILGDAGRMRQIISNFLSNALKFTDRGGVVVTLERDSGLLRLTVRDSGPGIPEDQQAKLFQRFGQTDTEATRKAGGAGLGLSICKLLTEHMGGDVGVTSTLGQGSAFWVTLPITEAASPEYDDPSDDAIEDVDDALRVLVAEDNAINQEVMTALLENLGLRADFVENGREAIDALGRAAYDIVLMDIQMPVMDGVEALQAIQAMDLRPRPPILAVTADALTDQVQRYRELGFADVVSKPLTARSLLTAMARQLNGAETETEDCRQAGTA